MWRYPRILLALTIIILATNVAYADPKQRDTFPSFDQLLDHVSEELRQKIKRDQSRPYNPSQTTIIRRSAYQFRGEVIARTEFATDAVNVRSGPGTNYPVISRLSRGQAAKVTGIVRGRFDVTQWRRISNGNRVGYVHGRYLNQKQIAADTSPSTITAEKTATNKTPQKDEQKKLALQKREQDLRNDQNDSFQQVLNYIVTADPLKRDNGLYRAKIFDREKCIAGFVDINGGHLKIYWNNIDKKSVKIAHQYRDRVWMNYLIVSGVPHAVEFQPKNLLVMAGLQAKGLRPGKSSAAEIPIGSPKTYDRNRLAKAVKLLYAKHCSGSKKKTAF